MQFQLNESISILRATPKIIFQMVHDLPDKWHRSNEGENTFSPFDVVGHLIHGEETDWKPRARIILTEGEKRPFDPYDRFAQFTRFKNTSMNELLTMFASVREQNLQTLLSWNLTKEQLALTGTHPALGIVTLQQLIATWVVHDMSHISQIARVISKQYSNEVGPWKEYLSVLK